MRLHLITLLPCFGDRLVSGPLFGGHRRGDGLTEFMLDVEQVRRVVRFEIMFNIRQKTRSLITGGLNHLAVERRQGGRHKLMPAGLIAGLSQLFQNNEIAVGVHRHQAKAARKRFVLRHGDVFAGHILGQACGFSLAVGDHCFFNPAVNLLLSPVGGRDKAVKPRQVEEEADQANAARPDFDANQVEGHHQPV